MSGDNFKTPRVLLGVRRHPLFAFGLARGLRQPYLLAGGAAGRARTSGGRRAVVARSDSVSTSERMHS